MRSRSLAVVVVVALVSSWAQPGRAETPCEDCWTDKCPEMKGIAPKCKAKAAPPKDTKKTTPPAEEVCAAGKEKNPDTAGHCCWRGQAWNGARCVGAPTACPDGYVVDAANETCAVPACSANMVRALDGVHCCWPGQAYSSRSKQCVGQPQCPPSYSVEGARCVSPAERAEREEALRKAASSDEAERLRAQVEEERRLREQAENAARLEREQREQQQAARAQWEAEQRAQAERDAAARAEAERKAQEEAAAAKAAEEAAAAASADETFGIVMGVLLATGLVVLVVFLLTELENA